MKSVRSSNLRPHREVGELEFLGGKCVICGGRANRIRKFARWQEEELFLCHCRDCGSEAISPQPSSEWLAQEYMNYNLRRLGNSERYRPKSHYFSKLLAATKIDFNEKKVLEVGPGEGDCLYALRQNWPAAQLYSVEANDGAAPYMAELMATHFNQSIEDWLNVNVAIKFDVLLLFDLLEHLRDPVSVLRKMVGRHLNKGGQIVATFPCVDSCSRRALARLWPQYKVEHLHYFSFKAVSFLEKEAGIKRVNLYPLKKKLPLEYLLQVGSNFGPKFTRRALSLFYNIIPKAVQGVEFPLYLGEAMWVAIND